MTAAIICAACGCEFTPNRSEAEAEAELAADYPGFGKDECDVVCSDCYRKIPIMYEQKIDVAAVLSTVAACKPLLAGKAPNVQGAALCDMLAIWLAGNRVENDDGTIDRAATDKLRKELLDEHLKLLPTLVCANDAIIEFRKIR